MKEVFPGVWMFRLGRCEEKTPVALRFTEPDVDGLKALPAVAGSPRVSVGRAGRRGYVVEIPLDADEQLYGLGLQLLSFNQRGRKKTLRVNSDPAVDLGDSHAPVPLYVSTAGYAVLIDTARYATFYMGSAKKLPGVKTDVSEIAPGGSRGFGSGGASANPPLPRGAIEQSENPPLPRGAIEQTDNPSLPGGAIEQTDISSAPSLSTETLYAARAEAPTATVTVEVPAAEGVDVYVFAGPTMLQAVQRYNLFSGGGCLPPRWGLGVWYRGRTDFDAGQIRGLARGLRQAGIPCDVLGLEPGWQSHAYSCTHVWSGKFPDPAGLMADLAADGFRTNLWTHVFTHPDSPIYGPLRGRAGDYEVWGGLVPDLLDPAARDIFADHHEREHVEAGAAGYKLDECDGSDFIRTPWSFPEVSRFPSGADGEQMHSLLGVAYQHTIGSIFRRRGRRTYGLVRSSGALAAPHPFALYSDLYRHADFIRGVANCGFSGLLWCPEVRHAESVEDLVRRVQAVVFSPQALVNAWYIKHPPWRQPDRDRNNADELMDGYESVEGLCRDLFRLRMALVPYLYAAFARYCECGIPPFRALVMDWPEGPATRGVDDQWMVGDRLMVAPVTAGVARRKVVLPPGDWHDFWTGKPVAGGQTIEVDVPLETIPVFVRGHAVLPMAEPTDHTGEAAAWDLTVQVYGDGREGCTLIEDDGVSFDFESGRCNRLTLSWDAAAGRGSVARTGSADVPAYRVIGWRQVGAD